MSKADDLERPLTSAEKRAIRALRRLEKIWPQTLWLFSAGGTLNVMRKKGNLEHALLSNWGQDPDYSETTVGIENDGGDW